MGMGDSVSGVQGRDGASLPLTGHRCLSRAAGFCPTGGRWGMLALPAAEAPPGPGGVG